MCSSNIGPYYYYMFRALSKRVDELIVMTIDEPAGQKRPWPESLKNNINWKLISVKTKNNVFSLLKKHKSDLIVIAGAKKIYLYAAIWAKFHNIPCVLASDTPYERPHSKIWERKIKAIIIKFLFSGLFVPGKMAVNYRISQGFSRNKIWEGLYVTDIEHFRFNKDKWVPSEFFFRNFFLTVCRLSEEKNIFTLLEVFYKYRQRGGKWGLVIVGSGPQERKLKSSVPLKFTRYIYWAGWIGYDELTKFYNSASCFVLPSLWEPWGVVVNEAMACGLPIIISKNCGCVVDLCKNGSNGFAFDPTNPLELADLMYKISSGEVDLKSMSRVSREIISNYTPERWADIVVEICKTLNKNH